MLGEYTIKPQALSWPLVFFYKMNIVTGFGMLRHLQKTAEQNLEFKAKDQRRKFLIKLDNMLGMHSMEACGNYWMLMRNHSLRIAVKMVLR